MKVVLAEKPSVARDIASVVGANTKKDGYFEGNDYAVTYAFGHLVTIAEPEEMNPQWGKPWRLDQLPMIPENWKYRIADKASQQFNVIKKLFLDPNTTSIICATDAGREGEHIFRLIYKLSGSNKNVERLWISSLTADAIKDGLRKLKSSTEFDNLADAATARAHADWIVGLNFTRAYSSINRQLCTIGRVQTPTLALIVDKQNAIDNFKSNNFYEILATFEPGFVARYITPGAEPQTRLIDKAVAESIFNAVDPLTEGIVKSVVTQEKKTKAPALYDLLTLQKDANKRFGYTAQETLNIAQSLYEEYKLISYPRTESRHISTDMVDELPRILATVLAASSQEVRDAFKAETLEPGKITGDQIRPRLGKAYVDDTKLSDHHAIIPTYNSAPSNLPEKQKNIYQLVVARFLSIFLPPEVRDETIAIIELGEHSFRAKGVVIREKGWTIVDPAAVDGDKKAKDGDKAKSKAKSKDEKAKEAEEAQQLPALAAGQNLKKRKTELKEGKTSPPKPYDDASLLTAMKNAGQEIDDEDLASYMKQRGLGTPATRAAIIERLLATGYVERSKKYLLPTDKGRALINQVHKNLKDVALTASWEQQLADMQDGKLNLNSFETDIATFVSGLLPDVASSKGNLPVLNITNAKKSDPNSIPDGIASCPACKQGIIRPTPKGAGCNRWREGCNFSIWAEIAGKTLSEAQMKELLSKGKTKPIKGFKKKSGDGTFDAVLVLNEEFKVRFEFAEGGAAAGLGSCPQCKDGVVRTTPRGAGCSRWREGCTFSLWGEMFGTKIPEAQLKELVEKKRSSVIKGFKKKSGDGTYDARLVLNEEFKVRLDFDLTEASKDSEAAKE